jgi:transcriptional regulator with XRE-family HTH domain
MCLLLEKKKLICFLRQLKATQETIMTDALLRQLKKRRIALGLKQNDMMMRIGVSRQQYQRLESKGNPRLDTLELIAKGLNSELLLIPKEKLSAVITVLESVEANPASGQNPSKQKVATKRKSLSEDPWQNILVDDL